MYYEINVSLRGVHFFATAPRSIQTESKMRELYDILVEKFPQSEGYKVKVSKWYTVGKDIDME